MPQARPENHTWVCENGSIQFLFAKSKEQFLLRIEDTDLERSKRLPRKMLSALSWLGLVWDEEAYINQADATIHIQLLFKW